MDDRKLRRVVVARTSTKVQTGAQVLPAEDGETTKKVEVTVRITKSGGGEEGESVFTVMVPIPPE